jgi:hypothetical protein
MTMLTEYPPEPGQWGLFSRHIPGRVGYQCLTLYKRLLAAGLVSELPTVQARTQSMEQSPNDQQTTTTRPKCRAAKALHRIETEYADLYPLKMGHPFCFCETPGEPESFRHSLRTFLKKPLNQKLFAEQLDGLASTRALS